MELSHIVPLEGYTIRGEGEGGVAGFAKGGRRWLQCVRRDVLHYDVDATVGGKIAQLGSRLIDGVAKNLADKFFANFVTIATSSEAQAAKA